MLRIEKNDQMGVEAVVVWDGLPGFEGEVLFWGHEQARSTPNGGSCYCVVSFGPTLPS